MNNDDFPPLFVSADAASGWGQRMHRRIFAANMIFIIFGSVLAFAAELTTGFSRVAVAAGAAIVFLPGALTGTIQRRLRDSQNWFEGRAIAETVKSLSWRYMMRIPPYDEDNAHADAEFADAIADMRHEGLGKAFPSSTMTTPSQITTRMREIRARPFLARRDLYAKERLNDQVTWYQRKSEFNRQRARLWWRISAAAQTAAVISAIGVVFTANPWVNVVGIFGALAAAATAWSQLSRHDELVKTYGLAAQELATIEELTRAATTDADLIEAVRNGEGAISREHTLWVAKRGDPTETHIPLPREERRPTTGDKRP
jgi:hypothetical protein